MKKYGGLTQVELAGATGLSPATVSNIVKELSASGVLFTTPSTRSGRRAQHVTLAHALGLVAGVHFATRHLRIILADVTQKVLAEHHMPLARDHRADNELDKTMMLLSDMLEDVGSGIDEVLALGIALPAPLNRETGRLARTEFMRGWDGVPVAEVMERRLRRPVFVDNAANLAALAEVRAGAGRGKQNIALLEIDDSIGAGLVLNGQIYRGHNGAAGEFGHTTIIENGPLCRCGNRGCLEALAGSRAILDGLPEELRVRKLGDLILRAMAGDATCTRALADAGRHIGVAAANLCNLLDPERIVVGGELSRAGELLLGPLRHALERAIIVDEELMPDVLQGQLGTRAAALGAVAHAVAQVNVMAEPTAPVTTAAMDAR